MGSAALGSPDRAGFARPAVKEQALCPGRGVFILNVSHVRLVTQVDLVRVAFGVDSTGAARLSPNTRKARVEAR